MAHVVGVDCVSLGYCFSVHQGTYSTLSVHTTLSVPCAHEAWGTRLPLSLVLLLPTYGWDEPKALEFIRRRWEGSVTSLSLVPIETCLKSVLIFKWQEQRAAGDGSLFLRAWLWAEWDVVDIRFVTSCVWSCALSEVHSWATGRKTPWLPSGFWSWVRWKDFLGKGTW